MAVLDAVIPIHEERYPQIVARFKQRFLDLHAFGDKFKDEGFEPGLCGEQLSQAFNDFSLERFAEDVFNYVATVLKIPSIYIRNVHKENVYINGEDTIVDVCHLALYNVVRFVYRFFRYFRYNDIESKVRSVEGIVDALDYYITFRCNTPFDSLTKHFHTTLAFVVCLAIYLLEESSYRGDLIDVFQKLQTAWLVHFKDHSLDNFEKFGLFRIMFEFSKKAVYDTSMVIEYLGRSAGWKRHSNFAPFIKYLVVHNKTKLKEDVQLPVELDDEDDDEDVNKIFEAFVEEGTKEEPESPKKSEEAKSPTASPSETSPTREELRERLKKQINIRKDIRSGRMGAKDAALATPSPSPPPTERAVLMRYVYQILLKEMHVLDEIVRPHIPTKST